jgi:hypothetical protein
MKTLPQCAVIGAVAKYRLRGPKDNIRHASNSEYRRRGVLQSSWKEHTECASHNVQRLPRLQVAHTAGSTGTNAADTNEQY